MAKNAAVQHRLILFTGSSPGVGKSTLSKLLFEQLSAAGIAVRWMHEDDMIEAFERFVPEMTFEALTPVLLLQASKALVEQCQADNAIFILDSYLPGFYNLYGRFSDAQIEAFNTEFHSILSPLHPLVIYLRSDVETALMRGVQQRGIEWLENITHYLNGWQLPLYGGELKPLRTVQDVIAFFTRVDPFAVELLVKWQDALILDATQSPIQQLLATILAYLKMEVRNLDTSVPLAELKRYSGVYARADNGDTSQPLEISLIEGGLFINTYWPGGARLLPEAEARFYLEGTNRTIVFEVQADGQVAGLQYRYGETTHHYVKSV
jgi:thymidylate kinase